MLLTVAVTLGLAALFSFLNERYLGLQQAIGLMVLSLAFTSLLATLDELGLTIAFKEEKAYVSELALNDTLLNGILCFMLFAGSINVSIRALGRDGATIISLAIVSTLLGCILIGASLWWAFAFMGISLPLIYALLFGALISPTDPIAALGILGKVGLPPRLQTIINGESLFNDGVGVVLFTIALSIAMNAAAPSLSSGIGLFAREVFGAAVLGLVAAGVMHVMLTHTQVFATQILISLATVSLTYALAENLEVSGPIATVVVGLLAGNVTLKRLEAFSTSFKQFWGAIDEVQNAVLFVLMGLHLALVEFPASYLSVAATTIALCLAARWLSVFLPITVLTQAGLAKMNVSALTNLLTWGGLRGGLAIAMVLTLPESESRTLLLYMTYSVVAFSIIIQGSTIGRMFTKEQLARILN